MVLEGDFPDQVSQQDAILLAAFARNGDITARNQLVEGNIRLAKWFASKHEMDLQEDLEQAAAEGFIYAAQRFDPEKGSFSTYSGFWARQRITREMAAFHGLTQHQWESPEQNKALNPSRMVRLDAPLNNQDQTRIEIIADSSALDPEEEAMKRIDRGQLRRVMKYCLNLREQTILSFRFGFWREPQTLDSIGKKFGLTRERIRQIEAKSIEKIRASWKSANPPGALPEWKVLRHDPELLRQELRCESPGELAFRAGIHLITLNKTLHHHGISSAPKPSRDYLVQLYEGARQSQRAIAQALNVKDHYVFNWFKVDNITTRSPSEAHAPAKPSSNQIKQWYEIEGLTLENIGQKTKAGYKTVRRWFKEDGIRMRIGKPPSPYDSFDQRREDAASLILALGIQPVDLRTHHFFKAKKENGRTYEGLLCWYHRRHKATYAKSVDILLKEMYGIERGAQKKCQIRDLLPNSKAAQVTISTWPS